MEKVEMIREPSVWTVPSQIETEGDLLVKMFNVFRVYCPTGADFFALEELDEDAFFSSLGVIDDPSLYFVDYVRILDLSFNEEDIMVISCMIDALEADINLHLEVGYVAGFDPEDNTRFVVWSDS